MVYYILHYWWYEFTYLWAHSNQSLKHYQNQYYLVAYISHCFNVYSELILIWINSTLYIGSYLFLCLALFPAFQKLLHIIIVVAIFWQPMIAMYSSDVFWKPWSQYVKNSELPAIVEGVGWTLNELSRK